MKTQIGLKLDDELVARIDRVRDGSRTRFIEEAVLTALAERESTVVAQGDKGTRATRPAPRIVRSKVVPIASGRAHRINCSCPVCKPPKQAA